MTYCAWTSPSDKRLNKKKMITKTYNRITDVPVDELKRMMAEYGRQKSKTVRSSRKYLRSIGMVIKTDGTVITSHSTTLKH